MHERIRDPYTQIRFLSFGQYTTRKLSIPFDIATSAYVRHKVIMLLSTTFYLYIGISFLSGVYNINPWIGLFTAALVYFSF